MHHSLAVSLVETIGDLNRVSQCLFEGQRSLLQTLRQGLPFEMLHDEEVHVPFPADVMEGADVRMVQTGDRARLSLETLAKIRITGEVCGENLDRYRAIETGIFGLIDLTHASGA